MSENEVVKLDELLKFIQSQLKTEEEAAMMYRNHISGIELQAYFRAMEDIQIELNRIKFETKPKKTRKKKDDKIS